MRTKQLTIIVSIIVLMSLVGLVKGSTVTSATVDVHPVEGDITTDIFVHVRGEPYNGTTYTVYADFPVLYVYYDDKLMVDKMQPFKVPYTAGGWTNYLLSYDVTIKVPDEYPYSELGPHKITAVIEARDGTYATAFATFEIVHYIPPPDWWENLPQEFIDEITGKQGEQGIEGEVGKSAYELWLEQGNVGSVDDFIDFLKGEQGETIQGDTGKSAYELWLEQGNDGTIEDFLDSLKGEQGIGEKGEQGLKGEKGDSALEYALFAIAVSIIAILIALASYTKKNK
jgi:hypothetical protein